MTTHLETESYDAMLVLAYGSETDPQYRVQCGTATLLEVRYPNDPSEIYADDAVYHIVQPETSVSRFDFEPGLTMFDAPVWKDFGAKLHEAQKRHTQAKTKLRRLKWKLQSRFWAVRAKIRHLKRGYSRKENSNV